MLGPTDDIGRQYLLIRLCQTVLFESFHVYVYPCPHNVRTSLGLSLILRKDDSPELVLGWQRKKSVHASGSWEWGAAKTARVRVRASFHDNYGNDLPFRNVDFHGTLGDMFALLRKFRHLRAEGGWVNFDILCISDSGGDRKDNLT